MPPQCSRPVRVRARTFTVLAHSSSSGQSPCVPVHVLKEIYPAVSFLRQQQQEGHKGHKGGGCVLFRRGGIKDRGDSNSSGGSFHIKHRSFLLLPTQFHASSAILRKEHMQTHDSNKFHGYAKADHLPFQNIQLDVKAEVTQAWHVPDARECLSATATAQFHPFDPDAFAASRFKRDNSATLLLLRCSILSSPLTFKADGETWGCFSWLDNIQTEEEDVDVDKRLATARYVVEDDEYEQRSKELKDVLSKLDGIVEIL